MRDLNPTDEVAPTTSSPLPAEFILLVVGTGLPLLAIPSPAGPRGRVSFRGLGPSISALPRGQKRRRGVALESASWPRR